MTAPEKYLKTPVPEHIRAAWSTWLAVEWRRTQHYNQGNFYPPDQRFGVTPPAGMCAYHFEQWIAWRDRRFKGRIFGGSDGYLSAYMTPAEAWEWRRAEWDERTIEQMRAVEVCCFSGRSSQCDRPAVATEAVAS